MASAQDPNRISFLDLPAELRIMVYKYACALDSVPQGQDVREWPYDVLQLSTICHQITVEIVALLAGQRIVIGTVAKPPEFPNGTTFAEHVSDGMYLIDAAHQPEWVTSYARFIEIAVIRCYDVSSMCDTSTGRWMAVLQCMRILARRYPNLKTYSVWLLPRKEDGGRYSVGWGFSSWKLLAQGVDETDEQHIKRIRRWMVPTHELAGMRVPKNQIMSVSVAPGIDPPVIGYKWAPDNFAKVIASFQLKRT
ncbi:hypothetical protein K490DRAFT_62043 [Saccharata proteae CBS 121410]|uniref:F-box domain-containing protein n=1 Tax=Saccharata proteae CBS 121410 TaxID=1314787 RepID=A0A9P4I2K8_9PEZI|nr:hypothetical protein K490DRAFT_62043 [Saccharata proteae CBS 121410]